MLDTLPSEINMKIADFVDKSDLLNLRRVSWRLHQDTWQTFGSTFFGIVNLEFCKRTFRKIKEIAQNDELRLFVRELRIGWDWASAACANDGCRNPKHPHDHRLGQACHWTRESSGCLDVTASEMAGGLRSMLAERLTNCRAIYMENLEPPRPGERGSDYALVMLDVMHLVFFAIAGLPITVLHLGHLTYWAVSDHFPELPRRVLESPALTTSFAHTLTELRLDWAFRSEQSELVHIATSIIIRAKALRRLHLSITMGWDGTAVLSRLLQAPEVPPLTHLVLQNTNVWETQLSAYLRRFRHTLRHLHISNIELDDGEWAPILSECRQNLVLLEHFVLCNVTYMTLGSKRSTCLLGHILEWDGLPGTGTFEFVVRAVRIVLGPPGEWTFWVSGVRYEGTVHDVRTMLAGLEEAARADSQIHASGTVRLAGWPRQDIPATLVMAGRLKAVRFKARALMSIFDRPRDRSPEHDWPPNIKN